MLRKRGIFPLIVALSVALLFSDNLFAAAKVTSPASITVDVGRVHYQQMPNYVSALGTLVAVRATGLSFLVSGHLSQKLFKDGAKVKKGDVIAKLDDSTIASQLASVKANLEEAQSNYNRYELLKDSGVFSKQDYIGVSTTLKVAKAKYASVLEQEQQLSLLAPFSGTLGKYQYSVGAQVGEGTSIVDLVQLDPLKVSYSLSQTDKGKVHLGQTVVIRSDAWPEQKFTAKLTFISPTVNPNTGRFDVEATFGNPKDELSPGGLVHVEHILGKGHQVLVVPQVAVSVDEDRSYVYTVSQGKAHQENVIVGAPTDNGNIIIQDGLKLGDEVVVTGVQKLSEGDSVTIEQVHSSQEHANTHKVEASPEVISPRLKKNVSESTKASSVVVEPSSIHSGKRSSMGGEEKTSRDVSSHEVSSVEKKRDAEKTVAKKQGKPSVQVKPATTASPSKKTDH